MTRRYPVPPVPRVPLPATADRPRIGNKQFSCFDPHQVGHALKRWLIVNRVLGDAEFVDQEREMDQDLRKQGDSKEKAARISNAAAARGTSSVGRKGGKSGSYQGWTVPQLKKKAKELGMSGYSSPTKDKLIAKLRNH